MVPVLLGMTSGEDVDWQSSSFVSVITSHSIASAVTYPLFLASYQVRRLPCLVKARRTCGAVFSRSCRRGFSLALGSAPRLDGILWPPALW